MKGVWATLLLLPAKRKQPAMRLRVLIPLLLLVMAGALVALAMTDLSEDWEAKRAAERYLATDQANGRLVEIGSAMAMERGSTYVLMLVPRSNRLFSLTEIRRRTDDRLNLLDSLLRQPATAPPDSDELLAAMAPIRRTLTRLRAEMDAALLLGTEQRPAGLAERWFGSMTGVIDQVRLVNQAVIDGAPLKDTDIAAQTPLRNAAWAAMEQAGRVRALLAGALIRGSDPGSQVALAEAETRFNLAWENVRQLATQTDGTMGPVRMAVGAADSLLSNRVEPQRRRAMERVLSGQRDPMLAEEWFAVATSGVEAMMAVQAASLQVTEQRALELSQQALTEVTKGALLCVLVVIIGAAALMIVHWRVLRPLGQLTSVFEQIARGQTDMDMPDISRRDEVGDLARAASAFRAVHLAGQSLAETLRRREHLLDLFIRHAPTAIAMLDNQMRYVAVSRRWLKDYGLGDRDITGLSHYDVFPEIDERWRAIHRRCLMGERAAAPEDRFVRADGTINWVRWEIHPWHDVDGSIGGIVMFTEVITARKQAEDEMRRLTAELQAIVDSADNAIIVTAPDGIIRAFNRGAERMLGYRASELIGRETPKLFHDRTEMADALAKLVAERGKPVQDPFEVFVHRARDGKPDQREWTYVTRDGRHVPVLLSVTAIRDGNGEIQGFLGIANDIAHLKEMDRLKSEFISTVSHELRTPLTAIRASLGMVNSDMFGPLPADARQLTDIAQESTERLIRLINDLLDIEKIASGKMRFETAPRALADLLDQTIRDNAVLAERAGVRLLAGPGLAAGDRTDATVIVDPDRIVQAFTNLISNAVKFSPAGATVTLSVLDRPDGMVRVSVADRGIGIDPGFHGRIFQRFAQADGSDSRARGGTGLGLAITREIVERHGGHIGFETEPGRGTCFHIDLPRTTGTPAAEGPAAPLVPGQSHILICEDDPDIGRLLSLLLRRAGFEPTLAPTAGDALELLAKRPFQAMTLDLNLPDLPGTALFRAIRANPATHDLPIIVVTATGDAERDAVEGDAVGIIDWLTKPINEGRLVAALQRAVQPREGHRPRLLHVEDDADIRAVVGHLLSEQAEIVAAPTLADAMREAEAGPFDVGIIDIDMPDGCGLDVIAHLRDPAGGPVPVVVFTAADAGAVQHRQVAATLIKSRARNEELVQTIRGLIQRLTPAGNLTRPPDAVEPRS